jgi:hypothetical protein
MVSTRKQLAEKKSPEKVVSKKLPSKKQPPKKTQSPKETQSPNTCMLCAGDDGKPFYICLCDCGLPTRINDPFMEHLIKQMDGER